MRLLRFGLVADLIRSKNIPGIITGALSVVIFCLSDMLWTVRARRQLNFGIGQVRLLKSRIGEMGAMSCRPAVYALVSTTHGAEVRSISLQVGQRSPDKGRMPDRESSKISLSKTCHKSNHWMISMCFTSWNKLTVECAH
jgi:hypothetical protein